MNVVGNLNAGTVIRRSAFWLRITLPQPDSVVIRVPSWGFDATVYAFTLCVKNSCSLRQFAGRRDIGMAEQANVTLNRSDDDIYIGSCWMVMYVVPDEEFIDSDVYYIVWHVSNVLIILNSAVNFVIYILANTRFREVLTKTICRRHRPTERRVATARQMTGTDDEGNDTPL